jgi:hypothetical protein
MIENNYAPFKRVSRRRLAVSAVFCLVSAAASAGLHAQKLQQSGNLAQPLNHQDEFDRLKSLLGNWHGVTEEGRKVRVTYSLTAADHVLIESWFFDNGMTALTLYHMDNAQLIATHYCPIGNQPRLELREKTPSGTLKFLFASATNLPDITDPHEHAFELRLDNDDQFFRHETYASDGEFDSNGNMFRRHRP